MSRPANLVELLDEDIEVASAVAAVPIATDRLFDLSAGLVPPEPPAPRHRVPMDDPEELASLGGYVRGRFRGTRYAMILHAADLTAWGSAARQIVDALVRWLETQASELVILSRDKQLTRWYAEQADPPRALCIVGMTIPWADLCALQQAGVQVSRLPLADPESASTWVEQAINRWRLEATLRRRAWIVAPTNDLFTRRLADHVLPGAYRALDELGFEGDPRTPPAGDEEVGLIILLTHGDYASGAPIVADAARTKLLRACAGGSIVLHLGCYGAGRMTGERYGELAALVGSTVIPRASADACSTFALDCLRAGATSVIGHLDATWSRTFERGAVLGDVIEGLAEGTATAAFTARMFADEANRRA